LVGHSAPRRHPRHPGGVRRTAVQCARPWVPSGAWRSHGVEGEHATLARRAMGQCGRSFAMLGQCRAYGDARDPAGATACPTVSSVAGAAPAGGVSPGWGLPCHAQRGPPRWGGQSSPPASRPCPSRSMHRNGPAPSLSPWTAQTTLPAFYGVTQRRTEATARGGARGRHTVAPPGATPTSPRPQ
jgi:hypothetical protein